MDDIFLKYSIPPTVVDRIRGLVEGKLGKKDKEFYRSLIAIQRSLPIDGKFYVELLNSIVKVKKDKGKVMLKKSSGMKVNAVVRNPDGSFTVTLTLPADLFSELSIEDPSTPPALKVSPKEALSKRTSDSFSAMTIEEPYTPPALKVSPKEASSNRTHDHLRLKYSNAISGTDVDKKDFWAQILYYSLDKGRVNLSLIALNTKKTKEAVRSYLKNRYNSDVVTIEFFNGEDTVAVGWSSTPT